MAEELRLGLELRKELLGHCILLDLLDMDKEQKEVTLLAAVDRELDSVGEGGKGRGRVLVGRTEGKVAMLDWEVVVHTWEGGSHCEGEGGSHTEALSKAWAWVLGRGLGHAWASKGASNLLPWACKGCTGSRDS